MPEEGLGCLILGVHNALSVHAQPALEAIDRWLAGNALGHEAAQLIGLGPGLTPSGDDYLGGVLVALRWLGRGAQADSLWRWLEPRLAGAHQRDQRRAPRGRGRRRDARGAARSAGDLSAWEAPDLLPSLARLDAVGHTSGWDALAGIVAVARTVSVTVRRRRRQLGGLRVRRRDQHARFAQPRHLSRADLRVVRRCR